MATWIAHLRVAENILKSGFNLDPTMFAVGNISPDCGFRADDGTFQPAPTITHFIDDDHRAANPQRFYDEYVQSSKKDDNKKYSFLLGYYAHLLLDVEWAVNVYRPKRETPLWKAGLDEDEQFIWEIKNDWYGLDYLYLQDNPDSLFFTNFANVDSVPDYLDFSPEGRLLANAQRIAKFYNSEENLQSARQRDYIYLAQAEMDEFISEATDALIEKFRQQAI